MTVDLHRLQEAKRAWRATASEFRPTFSLPETHVDSGIKHVSSVSPQQNQPVQADCQQQQQHSADTDLSASHVEASLAEADYYDEYEDYDEYGGYYDEAGNWVACDTEEHWHEQQSSADEVLVAGGSQQQEQRQATQQQQRQQHEEPVIMGADDAVALLHSCYPRHPRALLQQLVEACECDVQQAARILSDMDFEQRRARIAAAAAAGRPGAAAATVGSSGSISASRKQQHFNYSLEQFPALGDAPDASTAAAGKPTNWAAVTKKPPSASPPPPTSSKPQHSTANPNGSSSSSTSSRQPYPGAQASSRVPHGTTSSSSSRGSSSVANGEAAVPWVETGAAVSKEYAAARAEASDHARVRNACFHQATLAYLAGDKALAKELSAKGKAAAEAMWAAHDTASSRIYQQRNARLQQQVASSRGGGAAVIDLHGLHVQEMMKTLPQQLAALAAKQHDSASVIVGVGRHTKGPPSARMGPAVEALLKDLGCSYKQPQPGLIRVRLH